MSYTLNIGLIGFSARLAGALVPQDQARLVVGALRDGLYMCTWEAFEIRADFAYLWLKVHLYGQRCIAYLNWSDLGLSRKWKLPGALLLLCSFLLIERP